jgi:Cdc6-like AAA superfamily ATPase
LVIANSPADARYAHWIVPFERSPRFTGRDSELVQLEGILFKESRTTRIAITGLGGIGKTNLLIELVHRAREIHKNCSIIWIPATNIENLYQAYLNVAQQLKIPGCEGEKANVRRLVQNYLSTETAGQWLLVFDNADDIDMWIDNLKSEQKSERLINYLPKSDQGRILFTTRDKKIAYKLAQREDHVFELVDMTETVAMQLLQKYVPQHDLFNHEPEAEELLLQLTYCREPSI